MNIKQHTLQTGERVLLAPVPSDAIKISVKPHPIKKEGIWLWWKVNTNTTGPPLQISNLELIGISDEITEDQAKELVDKIGSKFKIYFKGNQSTGSVFSNISENPMESFQSLLQSLGCDGRYAVLKEVK